jgi:hypothetical protein
VSLVARRLARSWSASLFLAWAAVGCGPQLAWYGHSPDRAQRVEVLQQDGKQWLSVDGRVSHRYLAIAADELAFDEEGRQLAFAAETGTSPERWVVVANLVEGPPWQGVAGLRFGPEGKRFVYAALTGDRWRMVVDGVVERAFDSVEVEAVTFSPDGHRVGYIAEDGVCERAVIDGVAGDCVARLVGLALANDARRDVKVVADAADGSSAHVFVGAESVADLARVRGLAVDPATRRWAAIAGSAAGWCVVVDGQAGETFDRIGRVVWAPDGHTVAYAARRDRADYVVVGNRVDGPHVEVEDPVFAGDGSHVGYIARDADRSTVTIDDRVVWESPTAATALALSDDGRRAGWFYRDGGAAVIAVDLQPHRFEVAVDRTLRFSRDGQHWAAIVGSFADRRLFVVVDGKTRLPLDAEELFGGGLGAGDPGARLGAWVSAELARYLARVGTRGS